MNKNLCLDFMSFDFEEYYLYCLCFILEFGGKKKLYYRIK